jgi:excisionase family DNA binding protein
MESQSPSRPAGFKPRDAAFELTISRSHLYNLIKKGEIRVVKIGHRTVVPASEIDRLLAVDAAAE